MGEAVPSGRYSVIFSTHCFASLFGCFQSALSGKWAQQGINPWRDKLGQSVASRWLTLESRAYMPGGMKIKAFDGEGAATSDLLLIGEGELKTLLHNSATARHFGVTSNGAAARSARSALDVAPRHLVFGLGPHGEAEVQSGEYLELVKLDGLHSGADAVSGSSARGAGSGRQPAASRRWQGLLCPADPLWRAQHCRQIRGGALLGSSPFKRRHQAPLFLSMAPPDSHF